MGRRGITRKPAACPADTRTPPDALAHGDGQNTTQPPRTGLPRTPAGSRIPSTWDKRCPAPQFHAGVRLHAAANDPTKSTAAPDGGRGPAARTNPSRDRQREPARVEPNP